MNLLQNDVNDLKSGAQCHACPFILPKVAIHPRA